MPLRTADLPGPPAALADSYREDGRWTDDTFPSLVREAIETYPDRQIAGRHETLTFAELDRESSRIGAGLADLGVEPGDVVSYQLPTWARTCVVHTAISKLGAIANPIVPIYRHSEVRYILEDSGSTCVFVPESYRDFNYPAMIDEIREDLPDLERAVVVDNVTAGDEESGSAGDDRTATGDRTLRYDDLGAGHDGDLDPPDVSADDLHVLLYTSGTTGDPKGVLHSHNTLLADLRKIVSLWGITDETTLFMPAPVTHITGLNYGLQLPFVAGMDVVYQDRWDPELAVQLIEEADVNVTWAAPPFLKGLLEAAPPDWSNALRVVSSGGTLVRPDLLEDAVAALDCKWIHRGYGCTEHPSLTRPPLDAPFEKLRTTDGCPAPGVDVKIVDLDTDEPVPTGAEGEILTRGPERMLGYLGEEYNEDAFEDGWFRTGDVGVLDEDGYLRIVGRKKNIIIRGGENISVKDVEDRIYEHPDVQEVAVVAMSDPDLQEKGCAYVKLAPGADLTLEDLTDYLESENIAKQKFPEALEIVEEFPETPTGKIRKETLRKDIADKLGLEPVER